MNIESNKATQNIEYYNSMNYNSKARFISFWHQINEIASCKPERILEIGIGNGYTSRELRQMGYNVLTCDIDPETKPDIIGSILELPFDDNSFDVVAAFEVLEHLPYDVFRQGLNELRRVSSRNVLISLPDSTKRYQLKFYVPFRGYYERLIKRPFCKPILQEYDGIHYWEVGSYDTPLEMIVADIERVGLRLVKTYLPFEDYRRRFFIISKE